MEDPSRTNQKLLEENPVIKQKIKELEQSEAARKQTERLQCLAAEILGILNDSDELADTIKCILTLIMRETGFDAVGIRLRSGDDFPYFVQNGFSQDFLLTENTLIARDENGGPCRDKNGNISLECTCGLVISGQTDPTNPLFTGGGSSWTNNSLPFLDLSAELDPRLHPRNKCIHQGYCSVALIPIRANREIVGLLQLNDRKKGCFTLDMIHFFEGISASIGVALMRKQAEEAFRESEKQYRTLFEAIADTVFLIDQETGSLLDVNPAATRMYGFNREEFLRMTVTDVSAEPEKTARATSEPVPFIPLRYHRHKDGSVFPVEITASSFELRGRNTIIATARDITDRKRVEEALRESEKRFHQLADSTWEGIIIHREGIIMDANESALKMIGCPAEEVIGKSVLMFLAPESIEPAMQKLREGSTHDQLYLEVKIIRKDKTIIPAEALGRPIRYNNIDARALAFRDITEHKQMEDALRQSRDNLENEVRERTRELESAIEKQRSLTTELLLTEVHERRRIAADLHDNICQSLAVAKLRLQNLHGCTNEMGMKSPLGEIEEMLSDAIHHTRSVLQEISLPLLYELGLSASLDALAEQINAKYGLAVILDCPRKLRKIDEDVHILLFQAVRELLLNIVKHANVKNASVTVQEIGGDIQIQVKDIGVGFDISDMKTTFNRNGGFGLFNIRERLTFLGGHLEIKSGQGMGTCIDISAPQKKRNQRRVTKKGVQ